MGVIFQLGMCIVDEKKEESLSFKNYFNGVESGDMFQWVEVSPYFVGRNIDENF